MGALRFVIGGARSGKSRFAERLAAAEEDRGSPVLYIATMEPLDAELAARVERHRAERPSSWRTVEAPLDPAAALRDAPTEVCALLDCVSLWISNLLLAELNADNHAGERDEIDAATSAAAEASMASALDALFAAVESRAGPTIAVSNEVGGGVVPATSLGRAYRDVLGVANQRLAARAERAWLLVAGRALELPPSQEG